MSVGTALSARYRLSGIVPLLLFGARFYELAAQGKAANLLWVCHISNLLIAFGLLLGGVELVRVSTLWLIVGAPLWPIEIVRTGIMEVTSIGTHYVGLIIGLLVIRRSGMGKWSWLYGLAWFLVLQHITRLFAPPEMNINLARSIYPGWEELFSSYWQYWLFTTAVAALFLWLFGRLLAAYFVRIPLRGGGSTTPRDDP